MKKVLALVLTSCLAVSAAFAATSKTDGAVSKKASVKVESISVKPSVKFGLKTGLTLTTASTTEEMDMDTKFGLDREMLGLFIQIPAGKTLVIQPELNVVNRNIGIDSGTDEYNIAVKGTAIAVPVLLKARFGAEGSPARASLFLGPQMTYLVNAKYIMWDDDMAEYANMLAEDSDTAAKRAGFDAVVGFGVDFKKVVLDVRFDFGLTNLADTNEEEISIKTRSFVVSVGYLFN